jgi:dihydroneopterin aldolase
VGAARGATPDTGGEPLFARWSAQALAQFAAQARTHGLELGFAGKLEAADAPRLMALAPDWIIFGAALRGADGALSSQKLKDIDALTRPRAGPTAIVASLDRVFVRDLTLDVAVGAYAHEHGRTQKMRFTVEVDLSPLERAVAGFSDVFSYDVIVDRLRAMAASGHHELVETLAEETARAALAHPRALRASVRAEKLDVVEGSVGVEIVREKR